MKRPLRPRIPFRETPDPRLPRCAVCKVPLSDGELIWCEEHRRQREARQQAGVLTDELDTRWHDSLADWCTRPPVPEQIGDPTKFHFWRRRDGWLLFWRGYPTRLPDCLAINEVTQELRQFVEVPEYDIWHDLNGARPAAHQERLERRWGNPQPRLPGPLYLSRYDDAIGHPNLRRLVDEAPMGVYGLVGWPYGLGARSLGYGSNYRGPSRVALTFVTPTRAEAPVEVRVHSEDALFHGVVHLPVKPAAGEQVIPQSLNLEGEAFAGLLTLAAQPTRPAKFRLESSRTLLWGQATGLPEDQLCDLLAHLVDLARHPALVAEFQAELRANAAG